MPVDRQWLGPRVCRWAAGLKVTSRASLPGTGQDPLADTEEGDRGSLCSPGFSNWRSPGLSAVPAEAEGPVSCRLGRLSPLCLLKLEPWELPIAGVHRTAPSLHLGSLPLLLALRISVWFLGALTHVDKEVCMMTLCLIPVSSCGVTSWSKGVAPALSEP